MRLSKIFLPVLLVLSSCGSPPKPPTVDASQKRSANTAAAVRLQACESDLQNTRIAARESSQAAQSARATVIRLASQQQTLAAQALRAEDRRNTVYAVLFAFGDTQVALPREAAARLLDEARTAAWIVLRGRTDGAVESPAESRVARKRSEAVRAFLVRGGVDPNRVRATWQPVGDNAADNAFDAGRRLNRRVEIELYRVAPRYASLAPTPDQ